MGLLDTVKSWFGVKTPPSPHQVVQQAQSRVESRVKQKMDTSWAEDAIKDLIADIAAEEVNAILEREGVPGGIVRDKLVEKAVGSLVDVVWEKVKREIQREKEGRVNDDD